MRAGARVTLPFQLTRQSLADMTGAAVETAIRVLSRWPGDGLAVRDQGHLGLPDIGAMRALAEGDDA